MGLGRGFFGSATRSRDKASRQGPDEVRRSKRGASFRLYGDNLRMPEPEEQVQMLYLKHCQSSVDYLSVSCHHRRTDCDATGAFVGVLRSRASRFHSMTWSARKRTDGGIVIPSDLAVL